MIDSAIAFDWPRSSAPRPGIGAGRVDQGDDGHAELGRVAHQPHALAVAVRLGHAEVALHHLAGGAALLVADQHHDEVAEPRERRRRSPESSLNGAVAVQLEEVVEHEADVVERVRALEVARELHDVPRVARRRAPRRRSTGSAPSVSGSRAASAPPSACALSSARACELEQVADRAPEVLARLDQVEHPVLHQEAGRLEAVGQLSGGSSARSPTGRRSRCGRSGSAISTSPSVANDALTPP